MENPNNMGKKWQTVLAGGLDANNLAAVW